MVATGIGSGNTECLLLPPLSYERPANGAIRELVPDGQFNAQGRRVKVDQVDPKLNCQPRNRSGPNTLTGYEPEPWPPHPSLNCCRSPGQSVWRWRWPSGAASMRRNAARWGWDEADGPLPAGGPDRTQRWYASRQPPLAQALAEMIALAVERIAQGPAAFPCVNNTGLGLRGDFHSIEWSRGLVPGLLNRSPEPLRRIPPRARRALGAEAGSVSRSPTRPEIKRHG